MPPTQVWRLAPSEVLTLSTRLISETEQSTSSARTLRLSDLAPAVLSTPPFQRGMPHLTSKTLGESFTSPTLCKAPGMTYPARETASSMFMTPSAPCKDV